MLVFGGGGALNVGRGGTNERPSKTSTGVLVFEGVCLVMGKNNQLPSKTSARAHFRWWLLGDGEKQSTTIENERACSFSRVVECGEQHWDVGNSMGCKLA
jgi:hypothetical protein